MKIDLQELGLVIDAVRRGVGADAGGNVAVDDGYTYGQPYEPLTF